MTNQGPIAGWYDDPEGVPERLRYWDGTQWTNEYSSKNSPYLQSETPTATPPVQPSGTPPQVPPSQPTVPQPAGVVPPSQPSGPKPMGGRAPEANYAQHGGYFPEGGGYQQYRYPQQHSGFTLWRRAQWSERALQFSGRSRRSEYWQSTVINCGFFMVWSMIMGASGLDDEAVGTLTLAVFIAVSVGALSLTVRRLHDTGRSAWWLLLHIIPPVGSIILIVFLAQDSQGPNRYGPSPKYGNTMRPYH